MDKKEALKQIKAGNFTLADANKKLKADKEVVLAAVKQYGYALDGADDKLKADKEVVLAAVKQDGFALYYADDKLKADKEIVLEAVKQNGSNLEHADDSLKKDKKIVLEAVKQDGSSLQHADDSLKKDKEIVLIAVKKNPQILRYADISLHEKIDPSFLYTENIVYGENLCCNQFIINESDINSTDKINDFFSRLGDESYYYTKGIQADPYNEPIEGIILGTLSDKDKNKLDSVDVSINDPDIDFTKVINIENGDFPDLNDVPKKGEIFLTYYYLAQDSAYELKTYKKDKNVCIEVQSFGKKAIATYMETPDFEFTGQSTGGSYDHNVKISFDDGKVVDCSNEDQYDIIETISQHLISKGVFKGVFNKKELRDKKAKREALKTVQDDGKSLENLPDHFKKDKRVILK